MHQPPLPFKLTTDSADPLGPTERWWPALQGALTRQRELAEQLAELSVQQSALVAQRDVEQVLALLAQREPVVRAMVAINAELEPFTPHMPKVLAALGAEQRSELESLIAQIDEAVEVVRERDRADHAQLETMRTVIATELAEIHASKGAVSAYAGQASNAPKFQDRQG
jgi:hypothetical protein